MMKYVIWVLVQILFVVVQFWLATHSRCRAPVPDSYQTSFAIEDEPRTTANSVTASEEKQANDLVESWCSSYDKLDARQLAALSTGEVQIIDRFGKGHHLIGATDHERFWNEWFGTISKKDFHPECALQFARFIRPEVAILQARVSYKQGIRSKGGEHIPAFSEIHTFVATVNGDVWRISAQIIVKEAES
jgi:hypothetical protein